MTFSVALSLSLFAFAFALAIDASSISVPPSSAEIEAFRIDVLDLIDSFGNADDASDAKPLIGSVLRLVFHDCAGPFNDGTTAASNDNARRLCDGCIDLDKGDHGGLFELAEAPPPRRRALTGNGRATLSPSTTPSTKNSSTPTTNGIRFPHRHRIRTRIPSRNGATTAPTQ